VSSEWFLRVGKREQATAMWAWPATIASSVIGANAFRRRCHPNGFCELESESQ
jgi:hypothetical protein